MTPQSRRLLCVFLASPSDLGDERRIAKSVIDNLNRGLCRTLNITIDLLGWEDTLPGMGRPQELINRDVDRCELFVGLLWQSWGTPTGTHSSGFLEEFERARDRYRSSRAPEMWIHFKDVTPALIADQGPEVSQVLAFKQALVQSREILFKSFATAQEWERMLQNNLSEYVAALAMAAVGESAAPAESMAARPNPESSAAHAPADDGASPTTLAAAAVAWHNATLSEDASALGQVSAEHAARMLASVKTWTSLMHTRDMFSAHDANFIFAHRESCDLVAPELQFVFQNILSDTSDVIPGWYWLRESDTETVRRWTESAFTDGLVMLRRGATDFVGKWPNNHLLPEVAEHFPRLVTDQDEFVRRYTLNALVALGTEGALAMLDVASERGSDQEIADARQYLGLRLRPDAELTRIIEEQARISSRVRRQALAMAAQIEADTARRGLGSTEPRIRYLSALLLKAKSALDEAGARGLLSDGALGVRRVGLLTLVGLGVPVTLQEVHTALDESKSDTPARARFLRDESEKPNEEEVVSAALDAMSESQLTDLVDFYLPDGREAYEALVRRYFGAVADGVRRDIDDGFANLQRESQERLRALAKDKADVLLKALEGSEPHMRSRLLDAAMVGIAEHGTADDLPRVRNVLAMPGSIENSRSMAQAIRFLQRFGTREDVPRLAALALEQDGLPWSVQEEAAALALRLADHDIAVANQLLDTATVAVMNAVFRSSLADGTPVLTDQAIVLLHHPNEAVRRAAVAYLGLGLGRAELESTLKEYTSEGTYYYNVVAGLDEVAFVPEWLRASVLARLRAVLEPQRSFAEVLAD
jgi:hypothetical protein